MSISECLKIYCKLGASEIAVFEYDIACDIYADALRLIEYDALFNSSSISTSDVISKISILASSEYIADWPQTCPIINFENSLHSFVTKAKEEVKSNIINGEFVEENIYAFNIISLQENGQILQKDIEISKEKAEALEGFDANDPYSLVRLYAENQSAFNLEATFEVDYNMATIILHNANKQLAKNKTTVNTSPTQTVGQENGMEI